MSLDKSWGASLAGRWRLRLTRRYVHAPLGVLGIETDSLWERSGDGWWGKGLAGGVYL